jgi:hypothetical protein
LEALDDLIGGCDRPDFDEFNTWSEAQLLHLHVVGALTGLTPLAGEAIAGWRAVMRITSYISAKPGLAR